MQTYFQNEVLKGVLTKEEEEEILKEIKNGNVELKEKLIEHNLRLCLHVANKFRGNYRDDMDSLISCTMIGLMKSINTYDFSKTANFSTYAITCMQNEILMMLRKMRKENKKVLSLEDTIYSENGKREVTLKDSLLDEKVNLEEDYEEKELIEILHKKIGILSEKDQYLICRYYGILGYEACSQKQLAEELHTTQSYVSRMLREVLEKLKREMYKEYGMSYKKTNCKMRQKKKPTLS